MEEKNDPKFSRWKQVLAAVVPWVSLAIAVYAILIANKGTPDYYAAPHPTTLPLSAACSARTDWSQWLVREWLVRVRSRGSFEITHQPGELGRYSCCAIKPRV